jgi:hypothetical protein
MMSQAGGKILQNRVSGSLAVTRGLGDFEYKAPFIPKEHKDYVSRIPHYFTIGWSIDSFDLEGFLIVFQNLTKTAILWF